jgi:hypothetical protein
VTHESGKDARTAHVTLYHDGKHPSILDLPTRTRLVRTDSLNSTFAQRRGREEEWAHAPSDPAPTSNACD